MKFFDRIAKIFSGLPGLILSTAHFVNPEINLSNPVSFFVPLREHSWRQKLIAIFTDCGRGHFRAAS
jgi:hypothetical protein